jgi:hypothetical protein
MDTYNDFLAASVDSGLPVHHPAALGRYNSRVLQSVMRWRTGSPTMVGGPSLNIETQTPGASIPFRRATTFRTTQLQTTGPQALTSSTQNVDVVINGSGYIYGIDLFVTGVETGNNNSVTFQEDAPWSAIDSVILRDVNGELVNLSGFHLRLLDLYATYRRNLETSSTDVADVFNLVTGTGDDGGSFAFHLFVPVGLNRRTLLGILGNQDRAQSYSLRTDIAADGSIYDTAPDNEPSVTIERMYENYAVPAPANAAGAKQSQFPDHFGVLHYGTQSVNPSPPAGGATVNHYLARLGNTIRLLILVFREAGSRADAENAMPSRIAFLLGDTPIFSETVAYRRMLMFDRYGFDAPDGVLVYDFMTDIIGHAGDELGDDWLFTNGLVNAQFQATYPSGMGSTNNSLTVITDDLQIPPNVNVYA